MKENLTKKPEELKEPKPGKILKIKGNLV